MTSILRCIHCYRVEPSERYNQNGIIKNAHGFHTHLIICNNLMFVHSGSGDRIKDHQISPTTTTHEMGFLTSCN